ncbi:zinc-dependent metalloprotease [Arthrobacter ginkgonis]|uniref:Zinc-dependent metalloprotease n=1 Tax=Arthrobacter ginkgonis TaxID=1630594 RepID=A0ABP7CV16_9MICC
MDTSAVEPPVRLINWKLAADAAARLGSAGPKLTNTDREDVVADLRRHADASVAHVHRITGLEAARDLRDSQVLIVDRASWARANTHSFEALLDPALRRLGEKKGSQLSESTVALSGFLTGAEMGAILAFLSSKVLGQYDPFSGLLRPSASAGGRLMLVAPNIVEVERELGVEPADFRLWVCLHEQTHRVQFAAAPWLRDHLRDQISRLAESLVETTDGLGERLLGVAREALGARNAADEKPSGSPGGEEAEGAPGLLAVLKDPQDQAVLSHLTAVMSLLEGHANVVMDAVDASIVPTVRTIRQRFNRRGENRSALEKWVRRLLGLDAKMRQYADGQKFVQRIVDRVGMERFNVIWERPEHLPTERELHHPDEWIDRMGLSPAPAR